MDWLNSLAENAEALWAIIIGSSGLIVSNGIMFVRTLKMNKSLSKVTDFTVIVNEGIEEFKKSFNEEKDNFIKKVKTEVINPLVSDIKSLTSDNAKLADISVTLLSQLNVPLNVKKQYFDVLKGVSNVSTVAKDLLAQSIANDEAQLNESEQEEQDLTDTIDNI